MLETTTQPVRAGNCNGVLPEFGRTKDVERLFGIKRGTLYNLWEQKKVRSVLQRVMGKQSGVRLWYLPHIREHLMAAMLAQEQEQKTLTE
jgi:hypothetical protein